MGNESVRPLPSGIPYITHFHLRPSASAGWPCPVGADCLGGDNFVPKSGNLSDWQVESIPSLDANLYRIKQAPPGHILVRGADYNDDQAIPCAYATYSLETPVPDSFVMFKKEAGSFVPENRLCELRPSTRARSFGSCSN